LTVVTKEIEEFNIAEIIGEVVKESAEAEENKKDIETVVVLNIADKFFEYLQKKKVTLYEMQSMIIVNPIV
jgi:hypothetical protein